MSKWRRSVASARQALRYRATYAWTAVGLLGLIALVLLAGVVPWIATAGLNPAERFKAAADIRSGLVAAFVAFAGVGSLVFTMRTFRMNQVGQLVNRFESAAKQIGGDDPAVRLAGVYALAQLADVWPDSRQACVDVLCAHARVTEKEKEPTESLSESRAAVLDLIARHLRPSSGRKVADWNGCTFDLRGASIAGANLDDLVASSGRLLLQGATLYGRVSFCRALLAGIQMDFRNATLEAGCELVFDGARLTGGEFDFSGAMFKGGTVSFSDIELGAGAQLNFSKVWVEGYTRLVVKGTPIAGGLKLTGAHFVGQENVSFNESHFLAPVSFDDCEFRQDVSFRNAKIASSLTFGGSSIQKTIDFAGAQTTNNGIIDLSASKANGGVVCIGRRASMNISGGSATLVRTCEGADMPSGSNQNLVRGGG